MPSRLSALAAVLALSLPAAAYADDEAAMFRATTINLSATGEVKAAPDEASISLGVRTEAHSAAQAISDNRSRMNNVLASLASQGVEKRDIQTSSINLSAQYAYEQNVPPRLTGYQAENTVTITVRDLARLGSVVDAVTAGGANQIGGISFRIADPSSQQDEARRRAVRKLRASADVLAQAAGLRVARLVNLSEGEAAPILPMMRTMAAAAPKFAGPTPVEPGETSVSVTVSGIYELGGSLDPAPRP